MDYRWRSLDDGRIILSEDGERFSTVLSKIQSPSTFSYSSDEISYNIRNVKVEIPKDVIFVAKTDKERFLTIRLIENFNYDGSIVNAKWMLSIFDNSPLYRDLFNSQVKCETDFQKEIDPEKELLKIIM